ncbi:MAG: type II secretion protein, partial [Opitutaceae bacterium]|nr:type II secretion protein [Opitutaceae bacterium]
PVALRVRKSAQAVQCISNLRTLAIGHSLFRNEFNGQSPPGNAQPAHPLANGHNAPGLALLRRYYKPAAEDYVYTKNPTTYIIEKTELCPGAYSPDTRANNANPDRGPDYGMLCNNPGTNPDGSGNNLGSSPANIALKYDSFYEAPSRTPLMWDAWQGIWSSNPLKYFPPRHGGGNGINVAFLDNHVAYLPRTDGRLRKDWWNHVYKNPAPDDSLLGQGEPLVSETR